MLLHLLLTSSFANVGTFLLKFIILTFVLGVIILVHELGHFLWAKKFNVYIYEFSIGMGPIIYTRKGKDGITYNIRVIPIGGFVSMAGEVYDDDKKVPKERLMCNRPWWQRIIILASGVINNFILAIIIISFLANISPGTAIKPVVEEVLEGSPAAKANIKKGDLIKEINGYKVSNWDKAQIILYYKNKKNYHTFKVEHSDETVDIYKIKPEKIKDENGIERKIIGISIKPSDTKGFLKSIKYGFQKFGALIDSMCYTIWGLISGKVSISALSGPIGIFEVVGQTVKYSFVEGIKYVLYLIAFLSINVGFINILPFPAFDGGHILFLIIEKIIGKPLDSRIESMAHIIGFALIMLLMAVVTISDIIKLF
ncbi:MAG: RIP metalloprotease RseP [Mollicutes bacterium]|nr:RIP metalloprotease RseP [Mollicutes bacterium]